MVSVVSDVSVVPVVELPAMAPLVVPEPATLGPDFGVVVVVAFAPRASPFEGDDVVPWPLIVLDMVARAGLALAEVPAPALAVVEAVVAPRRAAAVGTPPVAATTSAATTTAVAAPETGVPARQPRRRGPPSIGIVLPLPLPLRGDRVRPQAIGAPALFLNFA